MIGLIKKIEKRANNFLLMLNIRKKEFFIITRYLIFHPKKFYSALSVRAKKWTLRGLVVLLIVLLAVPVSIWYGSKKTEAAWWNDSWQYRKSITVTNNTTAENNVYISLTLDTSDTTRFQADCGDLRFTNLSGDLMQYYIVSGCGTASTIVHTLLDVFPAGAQTIYYYYGNPTAADGFAASDFATAASNYTVGSLGSEEKGTGPIAYWSFDEGQGTMANNNVPPAVIATGGTITEVGGYRIHTFTSSGTFTVSEGGNVEVLVVAGGGGGGSSAAGSGGGGGGGAGGLVYNSNYFVDAGAVAVTVGNGGAPGTAGANQSGSNGEDSVFGSITTIGGGAGARPGVNGGDGGSGGGGGYNGYSVVRSGGNGTLGQGNVGGNTSLLSWAGGAGGGGAGGIGGDNKINHAGGDRGPGLSYSISGSSVTYATGGSGGSNTPAASPANVGKGGDAAYAAGTPYAGGSGVVIVRYPISYGTLTNMSSTASPTSGWQTKDKCVSEKCLAFDGTDDYVSVSDNSILASNNITVSAWIKTPTVSTEQMIASKYYNQTTLKGWALEIYQSKITFTINGNVNKQANTALNSNTWYYVVATYDGSAIKIYVNGVLDGSLNTASGITNPVGSFYIGAYTYNSSYKFKGLIDEPKIYNYARSADQIEMDYNVGLAGTGGAEGASASFGGKSQKWMTDGLVGHWKMDEASWAGTAGEVIDASGNGNNGTAAGGATTGAGKFGSSGIFDGTNDVVLVSDTNNSLDMPNDFSISFWVNPTSAGTKELVAKAAHGNYEIWQSNTNLSVRVNGDTSSVTATNIFTYGQWTHVTIKYERSSGLVTIYKNGSYFTSGSNTNAASINNSALQIGAYSDGTSYPFLGNLDELRIYNRALSPDEINDLYDYAPGPVGYWKMDENTGTTVNDTSGNNYGLSFGNTPTWTQGKFGSALNFDNDDYVSLDWTDFSLVNQTIEFWIKADTVSTGWRDLLGTTLNTDYNRFHLDTDNNSIRWYNYIGSASSLDSNVIPVAGQWYYVTGTYDGTTIKIYVNGQLKNSVGANVSSYTTTGLWVGGTTEDFDGQIDDIKIYNYARTPAQIMADYGTGQSQKQPIGYWKFDEGYDVTAHNSGVEGSVSDGTISGATWSNSGKFGKTLNFDGNDSVSLSGTNLDNIGASGDFAITVWNNQSSFSGIRVAVGQGYAGAPGGHTYGRWQVGTSGSKGWISLYGGSSSPTYKQLTGSIDLSVNTWNYITALFSRTEGKIKLYINGKYDSQINWDGYIENVYANRVAIGYNSGTNSQYMVGLIDEAKIYNYALSADEIASDYNNQGKSIMMGSSGTTATGISSDASDRAYCPPGDTTATCAPTAEWKFDEGANTTANNSAGSGNFGTLTNGPTWISGKIGKALSFDGGNDSVLLNSTINLYDTSDWTVSAWMIPKDATIHSVLSNSSGGPVANDLRVNGSKISYAHYSGTWLYEYGTSNIVDGKWHYLTWVNHSNRTMDMYVDNKIEAVGVNSAQSAGPVNQIGRNWAETANALIDNVRIYNYARTPAQIAWEFNRGAPVGWWKMDESEGLVAHDSSGNSNSGTLTNMDGATDWVEGKANKALDFDGSDDYVDIGDQSILDMASDLTIAAWIKKTTSTAGVIAAKNQSSNYGYWLYANDKLNFYGVNNTLATSNQAINTGNWVHVVVIRNGTNVKLYINGKLDKSSDLGGSVNAVASGQTFKIGRRSDTSAWYYDSQIDDVRVYNYALTLEQIEGIYNGGAVSFK